MKKTLFAISAIAVLLGFTACTSENETLEPQASKTITIKAYTESSDTRTALDVNEGSDDAGYPVLWTAGDKIMIISDEITSNYAEFTLKSESANSSAGEFEGDALAEGTYTAYYPADYDGENWPTAQTYEANNIPLGVPMKATGINVDADGNVDPISFKNEGGILRLNLKLKEGDAARSVKKIVVSSTQLDEDIELNCETAVALTKDGVPFHIAVPAKTYTNLKFTIYDAEGNKCTKSLSSGNTLTVERSQITPVNLTATTFYPNYLCFTAEEAGASISMKNYGMTTLPTLEYSTDLTTWKGFTIGTTTVTLANVGDKVYFRATEKLSSFSTASSNYVCFNISLEVAASGNVMSLIDPTCQSTKIPCDGCFSRIFFGCSKLTTAPELPATTLATGCYNSMFYQCSALETAPELPATTLAEECYHNMFCECSVLETAPELPATTLAAKCYKQMFSGCSNLKSAPELPAEILVEGCYQSMFSSCSSLPSVTCLATDNSATDCVTTWLPSHRKDPSYIFYCASGYAGMWSDKVSNWTIVEK